MFNNLQYKKKKDAVRKIIENNVNIEFKIELVNIASLVRRLVKTWGGDFNLFTCVLWISY